MSVFIVVIFSLISAGLYRLGGQGKKSNWLDFARNTKTRDFGVPFIVTLEMLLLGGWYWTYILCFGSLFGSLTTYWKKKGTDAKWYNWYLTGFFYGFSALPFAIQWGHWLGFGIRCLVLAIFTAVLSELIGDDDLEEGFRGFLIGVTVPLLYF